MTKFHAYDAQNLMTKLRAGSWWITGGVIYLELLESDTLQSISHVELQQYFRYIHT